MINLEEVSRFVAAKAGEPLVLPTDKRRVVRLELNTAARCRLELETATDIRFLANVEGRQTVTFIADGPCAVSFFCDDEVWWFTPEMERTSIALPDAETFTKIATRPERNLQLEAIAAKMAQNADRRMAMMLDEFERRDARRAAENEALKKEVRRGRVGVDQGSAPGAADGKAAGRRAAGKGGGKPADPAGAQSEAEAQGGGGGDGE